MPRGPDPAGLVARRHAARARAGLLVALVFAAPPVRAQGEASSGAGAAPGPEAAVSGRVRVLERGFFGGRRESEDRGGVLVYLTGYREPAPERAASLRQHRKRFEPRLLPIVAGQTVVFPNEDPIYHNVFSVSPVQPFDLGQYKSGEAPRSQVFSRPGLVPVYCNIHPKMISYVVVLENGAFASTDASGAFEIRGVPAGRVTVNAWTLGAERASRELELASGGRAEVELELEVEGIPPHRRKDGSRYPAKYPGR